MSCALSPDSLAVLATWLGEFESREHASSQKCVYQTVEDFLVSETVRRILKICTGLDCRVALQFPDELLRHAPLICEALGSHTKDVLCQRGEDQERSFFYFILGDTSYGECCVDEVAAEHLDADLVVHYGHACLSPTRSLPVLYVFPNVRFESPQTTVSVIKTSLATLSSKEGIDRIVILYDISLCTCFMENCVQIGDISQSFSSSKLDARVDCASPLRCSSTRIVNAGGGEACTSAKQAVPIGPHEFEEHEIPMGRTAFLWFSKDDCIDEWPPAARNAALGLCTGPQEHCAGFYIVSLAASGESTPSLVHSSRLLRKRFALLHKANEAERIGIVPGTLGVSGNVAVIDRCKRIIKSAGKRSYTVLVGKPNPSKLSNFAEIDVFVLVACPENSLLDNREYLRPIITPLELEAALYLDGDLFRSPYSTDFRDVLKMELDIQEERNDRNGVPNDSAVALRGDWSVSVTGEGGAAEYLKSRLWQGLSYSKGGSEDDTAVSDLSAMAVLGQSGIASSYENEGAGRSNLKASADEPAKGKGT